MRRSRWHDASLEPVTRICSYCERHRILQDHPDEDENAALDRHDEAEQTLSHESAAFEKFQSEPIDETLLKSSAIIRKFTERHRSAKIDSPTTSCLKSVSSKRKPGPEKRVNFYPASINGSEQSSSQGMHSSLMDDWDRSTSNSTMTTMTTTRRRSSEAEMRDDPWQLSGSSSYYEPPMYDIVSKPRPPRSRGGSSSQAKSLERPPGRCRSRESTGHQHHSTRRSGSRRRPIQSRDSSSGPASTSSPTRRSSTSSPRLSSTIQLSDDLSSRLSLSQGHETSPVQSPPNPQPPPRILKPRDCMKRAALKKMLVYPPEGHTGSPVTLYKQWSNIDCHVQGDPSSGFRYKVYYLQKFESDKWFPRDKTASPFRRLEDAAADSSTDYG